MAGLSGEGIIGLSISANSFDRMLCLDMLEFVLVLRYNRENSSDPSFFRCTKLSMRNPGSAHKQNPCHNPKASRLGVLPRENT